MTTAASFPGPLASKRRRMRSGGNVSTGGASTMSYNSTNGMHQTQQNPEDDPSPEENVSEQKTTQTSKCKGATTIPIFLKKTYKMIDTCDQSIASWTEEGDMFVVKDPDLFSKQVIPQYFDHNKFSSFARQLNFYGFRKMQSKPIRNSDFDAGTAKHVTFYNENFKKGRCDLLKKIQRSTRGGVALTPGDQAREIMLLREQVANLEQQVSDMAVSTEERVRRLELDMLARMEQMMLAVQQQQRTQLQLEKATSVGTMNSVASSQHSNLSQQHQQHLQQQQMAHVQAATNAWDNNPYGSYRASSVSSAINSVANAMGAPQQQQQLSYHMAQQQQQQLMNGAHNINGNVSNNVNGSPAPTLPPHPKQKQGLPMLGDGLRGNMSAPPDRMNSLRGISTLSRGLSGLVRGTSIESSASAVLMRNSWEDKFFSMLMLDGANGGANGGSNSNGNEPPLTEANLSPTPLAERRSATETNASMPTLQSLLPQDQSNDKLGGGMQEMPEHDDDLSDVSSGDLP